MLLLTEVSFPSRTGSNTLVLKRENDDMVRVSVVGPKGGELARVLLSLDQARELGWDARRIAENRWVVSDSKGSGTSLVLGRFASEQRAAEFISTLPEHESGRYNLDGPVE